MPYVIIREGHRERDQRIYGKVRSDPKLAEKYSGFAHNAEEAADIYYHETRSRGYVKPIFCESGPERYQAFEDDMKRIKQDPEKVDRQWHGKKAGNKSVFGPC